MSIVCGNSIMEGTSGRSTLDMHVHNGAECEQCMCIASLSHQPLASRCYVYIVYILLLYIYMYILLCIESCDGGCGRESLGELS